MKKIAWPIVLVVTEIIVTILGVILLYLFLAFMAPGGPLSTDVTWYGNVGLNGIKDPFILNRYFHVFLQALFLDLAPSPLVGLQHYWAFLIAATCGLIYMTARIFKNHNGIMHGLLAVALFLSIPDLALTAGVPLVDFTAMMIVILLTVLVIISSKHFHTSIGVLILIGILFYLAFRTKETTLPAVILLFGFGMTTGGFFAWRLFFRRLAFVLLGMLMGMVIFILLNAIFLNDPFFGFRLADILAYVRIYVINTASTTKQTETENWYTAFLFTSLLVPFVLYLISAAKVARERESCPGLWLVWLVPLGVVIFVTGTIGNQWGIANRFVFPALPIVCALAPQFLNLNLVKSSSKRDRRLALLVFVIGLVLIPILRIFLRSFVPIIGWDNGSFLEVVFIPVLLSIVLALSFYYRRPSLVASYLITILILAIIAVPLVRNLRSMVQFQPNLRASQQLFYPFSAFRDQVGYSPDMHMYISLDTWQAVNMASFAKDRTEVSSLYNLYFDAPSVKSNFALSSASAEIPNDLLSHDFTHALLSQGNWNEIEKDPSLAQQIEKKYQATHDPQNLLVLLTFK